MNKSLSLLVSGCLTLASLPLLSASEISASIDGLNADDYALRLESRLSLRQTLVDASQRDLKAFEKELLAAAGAEQDWATRDWCLRMLELVGTKAAVRPLAALLQDPDPRVADLARRALSANPSRRAGSVLEKAMLKAPAAERGAYADALAYRGDRGAVRELAAVLKTGEADAALALGKIGGSTAERALRRAHADAEGPLQAAIEEALLDSGLDQVKLLAQLAESGASEGIRVAAFERLLTVNTKAGQELLDQALANAEAPEHAAFVRAAMASELSDGLVAQLATLAEADQVIVLDAIVELHLSRYETAVLGVLADSSETLRPVVVRTLGQVGSEASFQPLLELYLANDRDREVTAALARLQAPATDAGLLKTLQGDGALSDRVAALRLLAVRNTAGVTGLVNGYTGTEFAPELRSAAFRAMELVGDAESVRLLLAVVTGPDSPVKRQAQSSLKKLSANLAVPDYLWTEFYAPALQAAANDDRRRDVLAIVDGNSGPAAAEALQAWVLEDHSLKAAALNALRRWTDISGVDSWLAIAEAPAATAADVTTAKQSILRILGSTRTTGSFQEKVERSVAAMQAFADDADFKHKLLAIYNDKLAWQTRVHLLRLFPAFLEDPEIATEVQTLLDRAAFN